MIKFVDLESLNETIKDELQAVLLKYIKSTDYILGEEVKLFEQEFANYIGTKYAVGVSSGTAALFLALKALGIKANDRVLIPVNTFIATALAVSMCGAIPEFVDIDEESYLMSIDEVKGILAESDCRYIIPVHLYGQVISVELFDFIKTYYKNDAATVEDACQAHGAMYVESGKRVGSIGDCGCFSFYPGKNLGGFGDGGIVTTNNQLIYEKLKMLRDYGQEKKYYHTEEGYNMRLDTLQAAILRVKLKYLDKWNLNRISLAELYDKKLQDIKQIQIPKQVSHHIYHLYVIRVERRDELLNFLYKERDIQCGLHYPIPLHLQRVYDGLNYEIGDFPIAEMVAKEIISLPMHPMLTEDQIDDIVLGIKAFYAR